RGTLAVWGASTGPIPLYDPSTMPYTDEKYKVEHQITMWRYTNVFLLVSLLLVCGCSHNQRYYLDKGNRLYTQRKYAEAVLNYQNSVKRDPNFAEAHYRLGLAQMKEGNRTQA